MAPFSIILFFASLGLAIGAILRISEVQTIDKIKRRVENSEFDLYQSEIFSGFLKLVVPGLCFLAGTLASDPSNCLIQFLLFCGFIQIGYFAIKIKKIRYF